MKKDIEKTNLGCWAENFFNNDEVKKPVITISRLIVGNNYYDFAKTSDGTTLSYLTTFPGTFYYNFETCYLSFYSQLYASSNWNNVKENFIKANLAYIRKYSPEFAEQAEKEEITDSYLAYIISNFCYINFLKDNTPENHSSAEEIYGYLEKSIGEPNILKLASLLDEYAASRDKYPSFNDFAPRLNEFFNSIKIE